MITRINFTESDYFDMLPLDIITEGTISTIPNSPYSIDISKPDQGKKWTHGPRVKLMQGSSNMGCVNCYISEDNTCKDLDMLMSKSKNQIKVGGRDGVKQVYREIVTGFVVYARDFIIDYSTNNGIMFKDNLKELFEYYFYLASIHSNDYYEVGDFAHQYRNGDKRKLRWRSGPNNAIFPNNYIQAIPYLKFITEDGCIH